MSEFQFRLWKKMIRFIQDYYDGKTTFHSVVCGLQKALDTANLKDMELVRKWYECFNPIEEADSEAWYEMKDLDYEKINPFLQKMREFLMEQEQNLNLCPLHPATHRKPAHSKS